MIDEMARKMTQLKAEALGEATRFCPSDETIAMLFDGRGNSGANLQRHLADCPYCRARLGMLARLQKDDIRPSVPEEMLAATKLLAAPVMSPRRRRWPAWAAAATVVLAVGHIILRQVPPGLDTGMSASPAEEPVLRSIEPPTGRLRVLNPVEGALVNPDGLEIRWSGIEGSLHYELYLLSEAGDVLMHKRTTETYWSGADGLQLEPGAEYYVYVEARLPDTRSTGSKHVAFGVKDTD